MTKLKLSARSILADNLSFVCEIPKVLTYFKNTCVVLCFCGLTVASKRGRKMFSSMLAKCGINFFDLKMSLQDQRIKIRSPFHANRIVQHLFVYSEQHCGVRE